MHRNKLQLGIRNARVFPDIASRRPTFKNIDCRIGHSRHVVTNTVICQRANLVIVTRLVMGEARGMTTNTKKLLSPGLLSEMSADRIGHRLKLLRLALGLTPSQISDQLDMPRTYWSRFEGGKRPITDTFGAVLVERYGVTLDFLILGRWDKLPLDLAEQMRRIDAELSSGQTNASSD
jgi:hypothetical protein